VNAAFWGALLEAQRNAMAIAKTGRNTSQGWEFVTVEEVTRVAREALNDAGLVAVLRVPADAAYDPTRLDAYLHIVHPESGEEAKFPIPWGVERAGPQARRAAYAYARKQALLELLALSEPDPETNAKEPKEKAATPPQPRRTAQRRARPAPLQPPPPDLEGGAPEPPSPPLDPQPPELASMPQLGAIAAAMSALGYLGREEQHRLAARMLGRDIESAKDIHAQEAHQMLDLFTQAQASNDPDGFLAERLDGGGS
jgi:ERF superfamily